MVKRRKKKHIRSTPEREKKTKAMKALWQINHSRNSLTDFWRDYLQDLATEKAGDEQKKSSVDQNTAKSEDAAHPKLFSSNEHGLVEMPATDEAQRLPPKKPAVGQFRN